MESISVIFAILLAILASGAIVRMLPINIPLPLIQIGLGGLIAGVLSEGIELDPHVFFLLFIPPLLFLDGWRMPNDVLKKQRMNIFQLAFGLVIITMIGLGYIINWLIPSLPLPVAFALAAILSPTDPVAVAGIARKLALPERVMSILEGEALFNDATGLVAFRMAVLVAVTGTFSIYNAAGTFLWVALIGIATGVAVTWLLSYVRRKFTAKYGEELGSEVLLSLLTPFAAYAAAEYIDASGVLAAVAAGITMSRLELGGAISPMTRMRRTATWDTLQFTLNGAIFVLLGEQLPDIFKGALDVMAHIEHNSAWWLLLYAVVIFLVLIVLRFSWIFISVNITSLAKNKRFITLSQHNLRDVVLVSVGGVRGTITLAGVLTLPLLLPSGEDFPGRDLAIFLAASVIIISLITASVCLPLLLRNAEEHDHLQSPLAQQKRLAIAAARQSGEKHLTELLQQLASTNTALSVDYFAGLKQRLWGEFEHTFDSYRDPENVQHLQYEVERKMRLAIIDTARQAIYLLAREQKISDEVARDMVTLLDLDEIRFN